VNTKLSELKVAGKGLLQSVISTANEFLNKFEDEFPVAARQEPADQEEPEVNIGLNIEVTVESGIAFELPCHRQTTSSRKCSH